MRNWSQELGFDALEQQYKLPRGLLNAVMTAESSGRSDAMSPKGAQGLFQFMPDTAKAYGIDPLDPAQAATGAARMYADLSKQHGGDLDKMLAGYNWGSGNTAKFGMEKMPAETRNYISKVRAVLQPQMAGGGADTLMGGAAEINFDDIPDVTPAPATAAPMPEINFDDIPDVPTPMRPADPNATMQPPLPGAGPDGSDLNWYERPSGYVVPKGPEPENPFIREAKIQAQGLGRAVTDVIGMPGDLSTLALNAAAQGANLFLPDNYELPMMDSQLGSDALANNQSRMWEALGVDLVDPETMNPGEKMRYNVNRVGGSAGIGAMGLSRAAAATPRGATPTRMDPWLDNYRQSPATAAQTDIVAGAGAGAGLTAAEELAPDSALAQIALPIIGATGSVSGMSLAGATKDGLFATPRLFADTDRSVPYDPVTGEAVTYRTARDAASRLQNAAYDLPTARMNFEDAFKFYTQEGLPTPGLGVMSNDPGLISMERGMRNADPTPFVARDQQLRQGQADKLKDIGPALPEENIRDAQVFAGQKANEIRTNAAAPLETAQTKLTGSEANLRSAQMAESDAAAGVAAARGMETQASSVLDQQVGGALDARTQAKNARFEAIPDTPVAADDIVTAAQRIQSDLGDLTPDKFGLPAEFLKKITSVSQKRVSPGGGDIPNQAVQDATVPLNELVESNRYLGDAYQKAKAAGNFDLADSILSMKSAIKNRLDDAYAKAEPGSAEYKAARDYYEQEYAPFFAKGFGKEYRDAVQTDPSGRTKLPPSKTADMFLKRAPEAAADLARIVEIAPNPAAAKDAVKNYMRAQAATLLDGEGKITPARMKQFLDTRAPVLDKFPEAKADLEGIYKDVLNKREGTSAAFKEMQQWQQNVAGAKRNVAGAEQYINDSPLRLLIDNEPVNAVGKVLGDGDPETRMKETLALIGDNADAKAAFKKAVSDYMRNTFTGARRELTEGGDFAAEQGRIERFFKKPGVEKAIAEVYADDPDAMNSLRVARKVAQDIAKRNVQASTGSATQENKGLDRALGLTESVLRVTQGSLRGGSNMRSLRIAISNIPGLNNDAAVQRLLVRAQLEPEVAKVLFSKNTEKLPRTVWLKRLTALLGTSAAARESGENDQQDQP